MMIRWLILLLLIAVPAIAAPADRYETEWADRAAEAQTPEQRTALAGQLLDAAKNAADRAYSVYLCFKAYEFGSRQISGYDAAAKALNLAQQRDPARRVDCLDRMRFLYDSAYERSPHKLKLGVGLADVLGELAETRVDEAVSAFDLSRQSPIETMMQIASALEEAERCVEILQQVVTRAREDQRKALEQGRDGLADALKKFEADHVPMVRQASERSERMTAVHKRFHDLVELTQRFRTDPSEKNAQSVAAMYLIEFDQPHRISPQMLAALPGSMAGPAKLAAVKVDSLDADEALMLCRWYRDLAKLAQTDETRQSMLIRAELYAERVRVLHDDRADEHRKPIEDALVAAGVSHEQIPARTEALRARLEAVGHGQALAIADPTDTHLADPDGGNEQPQLTDASNDTVGGRPMSVCEKCGRRFFPGWGVKATTCERCQSGHRNIFDFGQ